MTNGKRTVRLKFKKIWKDGRQDDTIYEIKIFIECNPENPDDYDSNATIGFMDCYDDFSPYSCVSKDSKDPIVAVVNPAPNNPDQTRKEFPKDYTNDELEKKFGLKPEDVRDVAPQNETIYNSTTGKHEPNPSYKAYTGTIVDVIVSPDCKIGDDDTNEIQNYLDSNPLIIMPVPSQTQTVKIQVENKSVYKLPLTDTQHAIWHFNLVITSEPTDPPLLEDNDGSKDYGIVKAFYFDYFSKSWQITEKKTYSNVLESLPKGTKIRNWETTTTELKNEGIDVLLNTVADQAALMSHSLIKTKSLRARVTRRPRELRQAKQDATKMIDRSAKANKEDANNMQLIDNYEREINQLKLDEFDQRLSKSTNKFFGDSDSEPINGIKLDKGTQLQSFNVPLLPNSKQPKFIPALLARLGWITVGTWLAEALSEAYQTVKIAALAGIIQAGIVWIVETIFTSGIDLFKELVIEKFIDDAVIHDDKVTGSWDTRKIHYELPRCNELRFNFREGVRAELTVTILLHETEQKEYLNHNGDEQ